MGGRRGYSRQKVAIMKMIEVDSHRNKPDTTVKVHKMFLIVDSNDFFLLLQTSGGINAFVKAKVTIVNEEYDDNH